VSHRPPAPVDSRERLGVVLRPRLISWLRSRRFALLAGLAAAGPVIVSGATAVADQWTPYGDRAVIAARSFDVFTVHSPLVGQYTQWSQILGRPIFSPGPLLYWLLAIPTHFLGAAALPIWMTAVNVASIMASVLLARRRGGVALACATAMALLLMQRSLNSETFHDIWNPATALMPFVVLCFATWAVACGDYRLLPATVLLVSFLVQTHLTYTAPSLALFVVAVAGLTFVRRATEASRDGSCTSHNPAVRRWVAAGIAVAFVCWLAPLGNQVLGSGNLRLLASAVQTAHGQLGVAPGWHTIVRAFGIPPWWLGAPLNVFERLHAIAATPAWGSILSCVALVASLSVLLVAGMRRRRPDLSSAAAIALVLIFSVGASVASTPTQDHLQFTLDYTLWWASPAGMVVWLLLGWLLARWMSERRTSSRNAAAEIPGRWARWAPAAAAVALCAIAVAVSAGQPSDGDRGEYQPFRTVANGLARSVPSRSTVYVAADHSLQGVELAAEVVYALQRHGATVYAAPELVPLIGSQYTLGRHHYQDRVDVAFNHDGPPHSRLIARVRVKPPSPVSVGVFSVALATSG
jgi:hypothetical protein